MRRIFCIFTAQIRNKMPIYIHQLPNWTDFQWNEQDFISLLSEVRNLQGKLLGKVEMLGFELKDEANLETLIQDVVQSSCKLPLIRTV